MSARHCIGRIVGTGVGVTLLTVILGLFLLSAGGGFGAQEAAVVVLLSSVVGSGVAITLRHGPSCVTDGGDSAE